MITLTPPYSIIMLPLSMLLAVLAWRVIRFSVLPLMYPQDPKEYPYWIPVIGHLRTFFANSNELISQARIYFGDCREPFALTVAGQRWYVLTKPSDVASTYKIDSDVLSYDIFAVEVMRMVGVSEHGIKKAFQLQDIPQSKNKNEWKHLVNLSRDYQLRQLSPGGRLHELVRPSVLAIGRRVCMKSILSNNWYSSPVGSRAAQISLYQWVSDVMIDQGTKAYFGSLLQIIEPDTIRTFMEFEALSWQAMYQYPRLLCQKMTRAKSKLQHALEKYIKTPHSKRTDGSWFILEVEEQLRRLEVSVPDQAIFLFQLYWSINANTRKAPFWILSYLLFDIELLACVRTEVLPALRADDVNIAYLLDRDKCPHLNSVWDETVRLTAFSASVRFLTRDVVIGGKILRQGGRIMMPQRQLHYSPHIFGQNAASFEPDRFLKHPELRQHRGLRPFGGGTTMCPGRNLAKQLTLAFIAIVLDRFELRMGPESQAFPRMAEGRPAIGLVDLEQSTDLKVLVTERRRN